jgi:hypothetical protein
LVVFFLRDVLESRNAMRKNPGGGKRLGVLSAIVSDSHLEALKRIAGVVDRDKGFAHDFVMVTKKVNPGEIGMARVKVHS